MQYCRMNGISRYTDAVEAIKARAKEDAERRLALIQNGKHPDYINGHPKDQEKGRAHVQMQRQEKEEKV